MTKPTKLEPCPWCKKPPITHTIFAECNTDGCPIKGYCMSLEKWNERAPDPLRERLGKLAEKWEEQAKKTRKYADERAADQCFELEESYNNRAEEIEGCARELREAMKGER